MSNNFKTSLEFPSSQRLPSRYDLVEDFWHIFDHLDFPFVTLTSTTNGHRQFPPYNIIESEDGTVRLEMAIAGYSKDRIRVEKEGNTLIIAGNSIHQPSVTSTPAKAEDKAKEHLRHRGISNASFLRTFDLKPNVEIGDISLKDGILTVYVNTIKPASPSRQSFEIK